MTLETTVPSVVVTACCAPTTSLFKRRLQRARLRTREERERHALHVVEQRDPQVVDESLAHPRRQPALEEREHRVGERQPDRGEREHEHEAPVVVLGRSALSMRSRKSSGGIAVTIASRITARGSR